MNAATWTTIPPTAPGFYWARWAENGPITVVKITDPEWPRPVQVIGKDTYHLHEFTHWMALPVPDGPDEEARA